MSPPPDDIISDCPENTFSSKYYDIEELQNLKISNNSKSLFFFHLNTRSLCKNFPELQHLLSCTNKTFEITAITDSRIRKNVSILNNLNIILLSLPQQNLQLVVLFCILLITFYTNLVKT